MPLPLVRYSRSFDLSYAASRSFVLSLVASCLLHLLGTGAGIVLRHLPLLNVPLDLLLHCFVRLTSS